MKINQRSDAQLSLDLHGHPEIRRNHWNEHYHVMTSDGYTVAGSGIFPSHQAATDWLEANTAHSKSTSGKGWGK